MTQYQEENNMMPLEMMWYIEGLISQKKFKEIIDQTYEEVTERDIAIMDQEICESVGCALDGLFDDAFDDPDRDDYLLNHGDAKYSVINWSAYGQDLSK